jgi:hypothetical protein
MMKGMIILMEILMVVTVVILLIVVMMMIMVMMIKMMMMMMMMSLPSKPLPQSFVADKIIFIMLALNCKLCSSHRYCSPQIL